MQGWQYTVSVVIGYLPGVHRKYSEPLMPFSGSGFCLNRPIMPKVQAWILESSHLQSQLFGVYTARRSHGHCMLQQCQAILKGLIQSVLGPSSCMQLTWLCLISQCPTLMRLDSHLSSWPLTAAHIKGCGGAKMAMYTVSVVIGYLPGVHGKYPEPLRPFSGGGFCLNRPIMPKVQAWILESSHLQSQLIGV